MTDPAPTYVDNLRVPGKPLGKRPPKNAPALRFSAIVGGAVPTHPVAADHFSRISDWDILGNDQYGDCGPVSGANSRHVTTTYLTSTPEYPTLAQVLDLYKRSGNPNFPADDNGVDMQTMFEAVQSGGLAGIKSVAFAKVDHTNMDEIRAAIDIFGFVIFGATLYGAQQSQTDQGLWDYVKGSESDVWGGHAFIGGKYTSAGKGADIGVETWAQIVGVTDSFISHQVDEVWVVIWPEHLLSQTFDAAVPRTQLADAYKALTGKVLPNPTPPSPDPGPTPTPPSPGPGAGFLVDVSGVPGLAAKVDRARLRYKGSDPAGKMTASEYTLALLASHLLGIHMAVPVALVGTEDDRAVDVTLLDDED